MKCLESNNCELIAHDFDLSWGTESVNMTLHTFEKVHAIGYPEYIEILQKYVTLLTQDILGQEVLATRIKEMKFLLDNEAQVIN